MNKLYTLGLLAMFVVGILSVSLTLAEENTTNVAEPMLISAQANVSIDGTNESISDDETVSGFKYGWEKFKMNFIRNQTLRVEMELKLAKWKIAEAKFAMRDGDVDRAERAMEAHDAILERLQERISKMENKSLTPGLNRALQAHEERLANLTLLLENANLTEKQREKVTERISKIEDNNQKLENVQLKIEERRGEKIKKIENMSQGIQASGDKIQERIRERNNSSENDSSESN